MLCLILNFLGLCLILNFFGFVFNFEFFGGKKNPEFFFFFLIFLKNLQPRFSKTRLQISAYNRISQNVAIGQTFSRGYKNAAIGLLLRSLGHIYKHGYRPVFL